MLLAKVTGAFVLLSLTSAVEVGHADPTAMDVDQHAPMAPMAALCHSISGEVMKIVFDGHKSVADYKKGSPATPLVPEDLGFAIVPLEYRTQSDLINGLILGGEFSGDVDELEVPAGGVPLTEPEGYRIRHEMNVQMDGHTFEWVQRYMQIHYNNEAPEIEKPVRTQDMAAIVGVADAQYIDAVIAEGERMRGAGMLRPGEVDDDMVLLFRLMEAANFLSMHAKEGGHLTLMNLLIAKVVTIMDTVEKDDDGTIPAAAMARFGLSMVPGPMGPFTPQELIDIRRQGSHAPILQTAIMTGNEQVIAAARTVVDPLYPKEAPYVEGLDPAPQAPADEAAARPAAAGAAGEGAAGQADVVEEP